MVKFLHIILIAIPLISLMTIVVYLGNSTFTMPIKPLTMVITDSEPPELHLGDRFGLHVSIYNPNTFSIPLSTIVSSTIFDKNAFFSWDNSGCHTSYPDGLSIEPVDYTVLRIPIDKCNGTYITNSTGKTNATVNIQYYIDGRPYIVTASKIITILPKTSN